MPRPPIASALYWRLVEDDEGLDTTDATDDLERRAAGEPLLGPRQGALIDAVSHRLGAGPPLSMQDCYTIASIGKTLGMAL
jgi:hypothetical protein